MPGVVGARFGVGPLPSFAGFLTLKKPCMQRHCHKKNISKTVKLSACAFCQTFARQKFENIYRRSNFL